MITVYGVYKSRAARTYWLLNEIGLPFQHEPVIQVGRVANPNGPDVPLHSKSPAFLEINPNGHIPSLDDDGFVLHESIAINLYLAKKYGKKLGPTDIREDALMEMWGCWALAEVETNCVTILRNRSSLPPEQRNEEAAKEAVDKLRAPFAVLDRALTDTGWLIGGRFTVADINVAEAVKYALGAPELYDRAPNVKKWLENCHARPAFKAMAKARDAEG